jgi:hypothetical protein
LNAHRPSIALLLLILWIGACGSPWLPWLSWKFNQEAIAERYCENRKRPELGCKGSCYLAKQLRAAEELPQHNALPVSLEFGWIGGLLPLDHVGCPIWYDSPKVQSFITFDWPLPYCSRSEPESPPPRV